MRQQDIIVGQEYVFHPGGEVVRFRVIEKGVLYERAKGRGVRVVILESEWTHMKVGSTRVIFAGHLKWTWEEWLIEKERRELERKAHWQKRKGEQPA